MIFSVAAVVDVGCSTVDEINPSFIRHRTHRLIVPESRLIDNDPAADVFY